MDPITVKACLGDPQLFLVTITSHPLAQCDKVQPNCMLAWESHSLSYITQDLSSMMSAWNTFIISDIRTTSILAHDPTFSKTL